MVGQGGEEDQRAYEFPRSAQPAASSGPAEPADDLTGEGWLDRERASEGPRRLRASQVLLGIGPRGRVSIQPAGRDDQDPRDDATRAGAIQAIEDQTGGSWRFGPWQAGLAGLGVGQVWFQIASRWILYGGSSVWLVPLGLIVAAAGGPWLVRRARPTPEEGVRSTDLAWVGGLVIGGILGFATLLLAF